MNTNDQYMQDFWKLFGGLERHGPGSEADTLRALQALPNAPEKILDIGSGTGASTIVLAQSTPAQITALDNQPGSLNTLQERAATLGLENIATCCASMEDMPFEPESFDLIWCEASAYAIGFENAVKAWRPLIRSGGHMVISELVWNDGSHPDELTDFWKKEYPDMQYLTDRIQQAKSAGYEVIEQFPLPKSSWDAYADPLKERIKIHAEELKDSAALADLKTELSIFDRYLDHFAYQMLVLRKS